MGLCMETFIQRHSSIFSHSSRQLGHNNDNDILSILKGLIIVYLSTRMTKMQQRTGRVSQGKVRDSTPVWKGPMAIYFRKIRRTRNGQICEGRTGLSGFLTFKDWCLKRKKNANGESPGVADNCFGACFGFLLIAVIFIWVVVNQHGTDFHMCAT